MGNAYHTLGHRLKNHQLGNSGFTSQGRFWHHKTVNVMRWAGHRVEKPFPLNCFRDLVRPDLLRSLLGC